ncbi:MAG: Lrp/AsnC family transcriptional regulator [Eubacteriales bacterium]|nr:Lrp/AsnC family transcriptional regulator [Eubacteriales bacterium]
MYNLDDIDKEILRLLHDNGRMTHAAIANELDMTRPSIHKRVHKLYDSGYIRSYSAELNWEMLGYTVDALIGLSTSVKDFNKKIDEIMQMQDDKYLILSCQRVTGPYCLLLHVRAKQTIDLTTLHDRLLACEGIDATNTNLILQTEKLTFHQNLEANSDSDNED